MDKNSIDMTQEIASRDRCDWSALSNWLPNPDPVLKKLGRDITIYKDLLSDPHVRGCVKNRKAGVLKLNWSIDRERSRSPQAEILEKLFQSFNMTAIISEMLDAAQFGFQPVEVMWAEKNGFLLPVNLIGKPPEWFNFEPYKNDLRLRTKINLFPGEEVPPMKFLIPRQERTYQNPYGFPDLSCCFWPVTFKRGGMKFWVRFIEKYGMPWPVGKTPRSEDPKESEQLLENLEKMVQDGIAVIPDDSSVEFLSTKTTIGSTLYRDFLQDCNAEISLVQLGHEGSTQSTPGKLGQNKTALAVREDIVNADKKIVEAAFNMLIGWIWELNFTGDKPVFSLWAEEDVDMAQSERDQILWRTGLKFKKEYFIRNYGYAEDEIVVGPAPAPQSGGATFAETTGATVNYGSLPFKEAIDYLKNKINMVLIRHFLL